MPQSPSPKARLTLEQPGASNPISREVLILCVFAPVLTTPLMEQDFFSLSLAQMARSFGGMELPFLLIPLTLHCLYRWPVVRVLRRLETRSARRWVHAAMLFFVSPLLGLTVRPLHNLLENNHAPPGQFAFTSLVFSTAVLVPAVLVQELRAKADNIAKVAQAERQAALEAQLRALQARTNPHFFFNSINTVATLIPEDPVLAERTLERLAELFRYALESSQTQSVPLAREVEMVRDYLAIQQARFGDQLSVSVEVDPAAGAAEVPPLLLQPLVENAIVHGAAGRGRGRVALRVRREAGQVVIEISDDGPGPGASEHRGTQTSVRELKERLRLRYGAAGTFELLSGPSGGCTARLGLPLPEGA